MSQRYDHNQAGPSNSRERHHPDHFLEDHVLRLSDNEVGGLAGNRENQVDFRLRRYMVPVRRMGLQHRRGARARLRAERFQQSSHHSRAPLNENEQDGGPVDSVAFPPSPAGFSSDSLADDSDFSSYSDFDDGFVRRGGFHVRQHGHNSADNADRARRIIVEASPSANSDIPSTSRGPRNSENSVARGNKRPLSSSSDSCVETGFTINSNFDALSTSRFVLPLARNLQRLRGNEEFTDVKLVVEDKEIACHRVVLAACSQYFHALLSSNMKEGRAEKVTIQGHKFEIVEMIVKHVYAQSIQIKSDNVQDIVEAADYFQLDQLKSSCENFLLRQVAETNCLGLMQFGELHSLDSLTARAKKFALVNFRKVSQQEEFIRLPPSVLMWYLSDDALSVQREEHVFQAAISWLQFSEARDEHTVDILKCVRLLFVSPHFLFDTIAKHSFLKGKPAVQDLVSEACKYHALGCNEWKQMQQPHTRPRKSSRITEVLFIVGGICNNRRLHHAEYYHPKKGWIALADIVTAHCTMHSYSVCAMKNNVYVTGGHSNSGITANAASLYSSNINQWSELASMICARERHGSATADGAVYVAGGLMASQKGRKKPIVLDQVERYRPAFNQWESVKPLPKRCYSPGVISYKEKLYVIGGVSMTDEPSNSSKIILNCIQCYDPLIDKWSLLPLGQPLARLCCTLYQDKIYMISNNASEIFRYDPNTQTLEEWQHLPEPGLEFAGLATFNGNLVITGGQKESNTLNKMFVISYDTKEVIETVNMTRSLCMHGCVAIDKFG
uniref:kelch-like protein 24 n=1 Tax=Styela clava TaxID=7725 RepID=UPI00193A7019|nr:kelch-like protein 24 [Styela clava]